VKAQEEAEEAEAGDKDEEEQDKQGGGALEKRRSVKRHSCEREEA